MILHIPHSSTAIPVEFLDYFSLSPQDLNSEVLKMTDHFTDELFQPDSINVERQVFPVSRLLVDPERFVEDNDEPMSSKGMGCVYEKTHNGAQLKVTGGIRSLLVDRYYRPHHRALLTLVNSSLERSGNALIVDCHSFPKEPLPYEIDQASARPQICIGVDEFHTPPELVDLVAKGFKRLGFTVGINRPFSGSIVPLIHFRKSPSVYSIMIEVRRDLYMDESSGLKTESFLDTRAQIVQILEELKRFEVSVLRSIF